eukprot:jgi/Bigna1/136811/aug1.36_g11519
MENKEVGDKPENMVATEASGGSETSEIGYAKKPTPEERTGEVKNKEPKLKSGKKTIIIKGVHDHFEFHNVSPEDNKVSTFIDRMRYEKQFLKHFHILLQYCGKFLSPSDTLSQTVGSGCDTEFGIMLRLCTKRKKPYARIIINNSYKYVKFNKNFTYTDLILSKKKLPAELLDSIPSDAAFYE